LALGVIQTVGGLGDTEWEWVQPGRSPTPDLEVTLGKGRTAGVEITSHVNSDEMAFQKAFESHRLTRNTFRNGQNPKTNPKMAKP